MPCWAIPDVHHFQANPNKWFIDCSFPWYPIMYFRFLCLKPWKQNSIVGRCISYNPKIWFLHPIIAWDIIYIYIIYPHYIYYIILLSSLLFLMFSHHNRIVWKKNTWNTPTLPPRGHCSCGDPVEAVTKPFPTAQTWQTCRPRCGSPRFFMGSMGISIGIKRWVYPLVI